MSSGTLERPPPAVGGFEAGGKDPPGGGVAAAGAGVGGTGVAGGVVRVGRGRRRGRGDDRRRQPTGQQGPAGGLGELGARLVAVVGLLGHGLLDDRVDGRRQAGHGPRSAGGGGLVRCEVIIEWMSPLNGASPVRDSKRTQPRA